MQGAGKASHYFLSANTPQGFVSHLEQLYNVRDGWKAYILKGGPGSGKSRLIEKTGRAMQAQGCSVEYIHCTSESGDCDGLSVPSRKICILDGTPPHSIDPKYPGTAETIINLGDCCDEQKLMQQHEKILLFAARISSIYDRACRFLAAAGSLQNDTCRQVLEYADQTKIERYATRIAKREFTPKRRQGHETQRYLSGITPDGVVTYHETAEGFDRVFIIEDEFGVGKLLLGRLRTFALSAGYDVVSCYCPMAPTEKLEHLLIPSLSLAFVTSNHYHKFEFRGCRHIHIRRFIDTDALRRKRHRIVFNRKAARELIGEAVKLLGEAKTNNAVLRDLYAAATDFEQVDRIADELITKLGKG